MKTLFNKKGGILGFIGAVVVIFIIIVILFRIF